MAVMMTVVIFALSFILISAVSTHGVKYAALQEGQNLATRIHCQVEESEHFEYWSVAELWGSNGGEIAIGADIALHCLGDDKNGKYGDQALKYNVQISNLRMRERKEGVEKETRRRRRKRGAKDFFQNSWKKVKDFFNKVFGRKTAENTPRNAPDDATTVHEEDVEEAFSASELSAVYSVPFQIVQLANGSIPEIRFSENEVDDGRVRNFKRHLADAFATQLGLSSHRTLETSVMGEHTSVYNITMGGEKSNLNIAGWAPSTEERGGETVVVHKTVTEDDIVQLAPSGALNDKNGMDLRTQQTQVFRDGRMISSSGRSSLLLVSDDRADGTKMKNRRRRRKRDLNEEEDATTYIHAHSTFNIQLRRRQRRSAEEPVQLHEESEAGPFRPASRTAEVDGGSVTEEGRKRLRDLQTSVDMKKIVDDLTLLHTSSADVQALFEIVEREVSLGVDKEENSFSENIRQTFTAQRVEQLCTKNVSRCRDCLQLMALAGGNEVEQLFLQLVRSNWRDAQTILDLLSYVPRPSEQLLRNLLTMLSDDQERTTEVRGSLSICLTNLASKSTEQIQRNVADLLSSMISNRDCNQDNLLIDLLEAIGNMRDESIVPRVLEVSSRCRGGVQVACAHALRHNVHLSEVQVWAEEIINGGDCDVIKELVGSLMDKIQDQEMDADTSSWPRFRFNKIDHLLERQLKEGLCSIEDILLYFQRKRNPEANTLAQNHFGPESEPWEPRSRSRHKRRAPWNDLKCREWTEDNHYTPIQNKDEFDSDRSIYNKRKSCLAFRKVGVKGANAEIYAGMFAGLKEPSDPPKYKLFTKFVSGLNFLGHQTEIGSFYFYLQSGKTKAYVRILGQTRQEFTNDGCTPTELRYRPLKHIPLYLVSVANVQLSLGIHLSSRVSVDTECPEKDIYRLQPSTDVRIGGEALGTVLFIRGAANVAANLNYKLQFTFTPSPSMCLRGNHGFDPMDINFESYFQLWNRVKDDWGKMRSWKPNFLSWQIKKGELRPWFDDTCIAAMDSIAAPPSLERELE